MLRIKKNRWDEFLQRHKEFGFKWDVFGEEEKVRSKHFIIKKKDRVILVSMDCFYLDDLYALIKQGFLEQVEVI